MGGKSSPNYGDMAASQGEANEGVVRDQTYANRPTQWTPWGSTSWEANPFTDPGSGEQTTQWTQTQNLSPELQSILNKQLAIQEGRSDIAGSLTNRMANEFGTPMDYSGMSPMGQVPTSQFTLPEGSIGDPNAFRQRGEDASYNAAMSRIQPQADTERKTLEAKMRNQGLGPEDAAWKSQMGALDTRLTDATNQAVWGSQEAGRQESGLNWGQQMGQNQNQFNQALQANQQNYGQAMSGSKYANTIRQQQMTEAMQQRGFSLNEINALLSGQQVNSPQMPSFSEAGAAQAAPIYQAGVDQGNFDQGSQQQMIDAATGLGSMAMMSDRRLKSNIKKVGERNGYNWYSYDIFGIASEGVMADEVPAEFTTDVGGYKAVDYAKLGV